MFELVPFGNKDRDLFSYFDNMARSFFGDTESRMLGFRTDILDKGDHFVLQAELPGFEKKDISIDIDGDTLTIQAKQDYQSEEKKDNYLKRERRYGSFVRSFDITGVKADGITAEYKSGVLELVMPKSEPVQSKARHLEIN